MKMPKKSRGKNAKKKAKKVQNNNNQRQLKRCIFFELMIVIFFSRALIEDKLGNKFAESPSVSLQQSYAESSATTPVLLVLSPGVDPSKDVERLARQVRVTLHNVSLGQGQEPVAEEAMEFASREGHWVMLQVGFLFLFTNLKKKNYVHVFRMYIW